MWRSPKALIPVEEQYVRTRDDPFFNGRLRGGHDSRRKRSPILDQLQKDSRSGGLSLSVSDIGDARKKEVVPDVSEKHTESPEEMVASDNGFQPMGKISKTASDNNIVFCSAAAVAPDSSIVYRSPDPARPAIEKSYSLRNGKFDDLPSIRSHSLQRHFIMGCPHELRLWCRVKAPGSSTCT